MTEQIYKHLAPSDVLRLTRLEEGTSTAVELTVVKGLPNVTAEIQEEVSLIVPDAAFELREHSLSSKHLQVLVITRPNN
jgi:hypothetical protein